jgi:hypothetical protein
MKKIGLLLIVIILFDMYINNRNKQLQETAYYEGCIYSGQFSTFIEESDGEESEGIISEFCMEASKFYVKGLK